MSDKYQPDMLFGKGNMMAPRYKVIDWISPGNPEDRKGSFIGSGKATYIRLRTAEGFQTRFDIHSGFFNKVILHDEYTQDNLILSVLTTGFGSEKNYFFNRIFAEAMLRNWKMYNLPEDLIQTILNIAEIYGEDPYYYD